MNKLVIFLSFLFFLSFSFSYFEDRYWCDFSGNRIIVTLKPYSGSTKCLKLIKEINNKTEALQKNINYAYKNYKIYKSDYWKNIYNSLINRQKEYRLLREKIITSMNDFEKKLFIKVKKIIVIWSKQQRKLLLKEYSLIKSQLKGSVYSGNIDKFQYYRNKLDGIIYKMFLINQITSSQSFEQLIPLLKKYINNYATR